MNEQLESTQLNSASITKKRQTTDRTFQPQQDGVAVAVAHDIQDEKQGETQESLNSKFADITNVNLQNNGFEYVDLKLPSGLLWAKTNLDSPSERYNNKYFAWKAEKGYALEQLSVDNAEYHFTEEEYKGSKLVDSAYMTMKGNWRMPTKEDFEELFDEANTTVQFARDIHENITGCVITSLKDSTAVLYLPIENGSFKQGKEDRDVTIYWTSDTGELDSDACGLVFQTVETDENSDPAKTRYLTQVQKYIGGYVRGVIDRMNINERQKHNFDTLQNQINNINVNFKDNKKQLDARITALEMDKLVSKVVIYASDVIEYVPNNSSIDITMQLQNASGVVSKDTKYTNIHLYYKINSTNEVDVKDASATVKYKYDSPSQVNIEARGTAIYNGVSITFPVTRKTAFAVLPSYIGYIEDYNNWNKTGDKLVKHGLNGQYNVINPYNLAYLVIAIPKNGMVSPINSIVQKGTLDVAQQYDKIDKDNYTLYVCKTRHNKGTYAFAIG